MYMYCFYPMSAVAFCGSIFMTLAVAIERYMAVCKPIKYRTMTQDQVKHRIIRIMIIIIKALSKKMDFYEVPNAGSFFWLIKKND